MRKIFGKYRRILTLSLLLALFFAELFPEYAFAEMVKTREEMSFDENLAEQSNKVYTEPRKILLVPVHTEASNLKYNSEEWVEQIYYFSITRYNFADVPFNYYLDTDGNLFEGRAGYVGVVPELTNSGGEVVVGYLSSSGLTRSAEIGLKNLINELSKDFFISNENISVGKMIKVNESVADNITLSRVSYESVKSGALSESLKNFLKDFEVEVDAAKKSYNISVENVVAPDSALAGEAIDVTVRIKNEGDKPIYTYRDYIYVRTANNKSSKYWIEGEWPSAKVSQIISDTIILPGESYDIEFRMLAGYVKGDVSQSLILTYGNDEQIEETEFLITYKTDLGDKRPIEITETGVGWINVRKCGSRSCEVIDRLDVGSVVLVEEERSGWFKINYNVDQEGWIVSYYHRNL